MADFDYENAWRVVALPAFKSLPKDVIDLLDFVDANTKSCRQSQNLDLRMPENKEHASYIQEKIEALPIDVLGSFAHIIYYYQHWFPGDKFQARRQTLVTDPPEWRENPPRKNVSWHLPRYIDQYLRKVLGIVENPKLGYGIDIHDGRVRVNYSDSTCWSWTEMGNADRATIGVIRAIVDTWNSGMCGMRDHSYDEKFETLKTLLSALPCNKWWVTWDKEVEVFKPRNRR